MTKLSFISHSLIWSCCLSTLCFASLHEKIALAPKDLSYIVPQENVEFLPIPQTQDVEKLFNHLEDNSLSGLNGSFGSGLDFMGVDEVFTDSEMNKAIFLKLDRKPQNDSDIGKIYLSEQNYIYNGHSQQGLYFVLYFIGFESKNVHELVEGVQSLVEKKEKVSVLSPFNDLILPSLHADSQLPRSAPHIKSRPLPLRNPPAALAEREQARETFHITFEGLKECAKIFAVTKYEVIKSATWDKVGRVARGTVDFARRSLRTVGNVFMGKVSFPSFDAIWRTVQKT